MRFLARTPIVPLNGANPTDLTIAAFRRKSPGPGREVRRDAKHRFLKLCSNDIPPRIVEARVDRCVAPDLDCSGTGNYRSDELWWCNWVLPPHVGGAGRQCSACS
jgi:hypothetical protein